MTDRKFCSNCGSNYDSGNMYCSQCGMSVAPPTSLSVKRTHLNHCTSCGSNTSTSDTYCAACGLECNDYIAAQERTLISDVFGAEGVKSLTGIANKAGTAINLSANLSQVKKRSVFMPALVFAGVAVGVGLILSFLIDLQIDRLVRELLEDTFGWRTVESVLDGSSFKLGATTIWLLTCFGGLRGSLNGNIGSWGGRESYSADASLSLGLVSLIIIPVIALLVARKARNAFIGSKHAGKEIRALDGLLGAGMFAAINLILSFFPTQLGNTIKRFAEIDGDFIRLNTNVSPMIINLLFFSFVIALVFAMPGWSTIAEPLGRRYKIAGVSYAIAVRYVGVMLLAGLIYAVTSGIVSLIQLDGELNVIGGIPSEHVGSILGIYILLLLNSAIYQMAFLTGGSVSMTVSGNLLGGMESGNMTSVINAFGTQFSMPGLADIQNSHFWPGLLVLVAGLWIAVSVIYKLMRNEKKLMINGLAVAGVSAVAIWAVSSIATISLSYNFSGYGERMSGGFSYGTATFANFLICAAMMGAAVFTVFLAQRYPSLDNILAKAAKPGIACTATALIAIVFTIVSTQSFLSTIEMFYRS